VAINRRGSFRGPPPGGRAVYFGRLWTLDGQPAPRCNREAKADPMGAFVRDAHFVRSPALAPARVRYPRQSHPTHRCGRLTIRCASPHPPLRVWSPSATPRCVPTSPRCVLPSLCLRTTSTDTLRSSWRSRRRTRRSSRCCSKPGRT